MHEGLLILSKASNKPVFCNRPAQKLLRGAIENFETTSKQNINCKNDQDRLTRQKFFISVNMAIKGQSKKFEDVNLNLEEIILSQVDEPSQKTCIYSLRVG